MNKEETPIKCKNYIIAIADFNRDELIKPKKHTFLFNPNLLWKSDDGKELKFYNKLDWINN
jgi:hypothetical protein